MSRCVATLACAALPAGCGRWGYVDKHGKLVITPQFDQARRFSLGVAPVLIGDRLGYIDKDGKFVWNPTA